MVLTMKTTPRLGAAAARYRLLGTALSGAAALRRQSLAGLARRASPPLRASMGDTPTAAISRPSPTGGVCGRLPAGASCQGSRQSSSCGSDGGAFVRPRLLFGRHVREALANGEPIVALESTVITHGLPEPQNVQLALGVEQQVRQQQRSCTPATIGIIRGQIVVGLSEDEIRFLANRERSRPIKASRRDIPLALACSLSAGTTVAATMAIAVSCGRSHAAASATTCTGTGANEPTTASQIKVFATGGTGGVHRGGQHSMDISADLYEFARSPIGVVSSGFKSFLDTRRSLEFLETLGCTVVSLHEAARDDGAAANKAAQLDGSSPNGFFPAFYSRSSGVKSPFSVTSIREAGEILFQCLEGGPLSLGGRRAMLLANPIACEAELELSRTSDDTAAANSEQLDDLLANISAQIDKRTDLEGKEKTPLILEQINRLTGGRSLEANVELLKNNARVGAHLAIEYAQILNRHVGGPSPSPPPPTTPRLRSQRQQGESINQQQPIDRPPTSSEVGAPSTTTPLDDCTIFLGQ